MYKVTNTLTSAYGPQDMDLRPKQGPVSCKNCLKMGKKLDDSCSLNNLRENMHTKESSLKELMDTTRQTNLNGS